MGTIATHSPLPFTIVMVDLWPLLPRLQARLMLISQVLVMNLPIRSLQATEISWIIKGPISQSIFLSNVISDEIKLPRQLRLPAEPPHLHASDAMDRGQLTESSWTSQRKSCSTNLVTTDSEANVWVGIEVIYKIKVS